MKGKGEARVGRAAVVEGAPGEKWEKSWTGSPGWLVGPAVGFFQLMAGSKRSGGIKKRY